LAPTNHHITVFETQPTWNYTSFLDIAFLLLMAELAWRFVTTGGVEMLRSHSHRPEEHAAMVKDPVCGMTIDPLQTPHQSDHNGKTYYFCSAGCKETFDKDPGKYVSEAGVTPSSG
jgi:YHS domain-containing protein